jgi:hypothetical protein
MFDTEATVPALATMRRIARYAPAFVWFESMRMELSAVLRYLGVLINTERPGGELNARRIF